MRRAATAVLTACALALPACSAESPAGETTSAPAESPSEGSPSPTEPVPPELEDPLFADLVSARNRFHAAFEDFTESGSPLATQGVLRRMQRAWDDFAAALEDAEDAGLDLTSGQLERDILRTTPEWLDSVQEVTHIAIQCDLGARPSQSDFQACAARFPDFQVLLIEMARLTGLVSQQQERLRDATPT